MNTIRQGSFLTLHYRLCGPDGAELVNTFGASPATLSIGSGDLATPLEQCLLGLAEGARECFELPAGEAFGAHNPQLLQRVSRSLLSQADPRAAQADVGKVVRFPTPDREGSYSGLVREVGEDWMLVDFNHPLAGQRVSFEVEVIGVM